MRSVRLLLDRLDGMIRARAISAALMKVDQAYLRDVCRLSSESIDAVRSSRLRRWEVRKRKPATREVSAKAT
jgi:hypothetical protein